MVADSELTKEQLLKRLTASKRPVTARQLERWSKAGHMARPARRHIPGVRGSVSVFPARAFEQAAALYDAAHPKNRKGGVGDRRLDERIFLLWWAGQPIVHEPRQLLLTFAQPYLTAVEHVRKYERIQTIGLDDSDDPAFDMADAYFQEHSPEHVKGPVVSAFSANLGRRPADLLSVMITMITGALGGMPPLESSDYDGEPSLALLVLRALGFAQFESKETPEDQVEAVLRSISFFADRKTVEAFVLGLSDEDLNTARKCTRIFFDELPVIFEGQRVLLGKSPTAKILRAYSRTATAGVKATTIIGMAWLFQREDRDAALRLIAQIEQAAPIARGVCAAAKAFPEYRKLFLKKNITRLATLSEAKRQEIVAVIKSAMA